MDLTQQINELLQTYPYNPKQDDKIDIIRFVKSNGFTVGQAHLPHPVTGLLAIRSTHNKDIIIDCRLDYTTKRFLIARLFARSLQDANEIPPSKCYLHQNLNQVKLRPDDPCDEAALALLLPDASVRRIFRVFQQTIPNRRTEDLFAAIYAVPESCAKRRLTTLGLRSDPTVRGVESKQTTEESS